jgi:hypothetical protein
MTDSKVYRNHPVGGKDALTFRAPRRYWFAVVFCSVIRLPL